MALLSYRDYQAYDQLQTRREEQRAEGWGCLHGVGPGIRTGAASYQRYQGDKLARRFSAFSYYALSLSMDSHDAGRGRGGLAAALEHIKARTLVIGIQSDILFPLQEQKTLAELIPGAHHEVISSLYGHDGFLLEYTQIEQLIKGFLKESPAAQRELINH
jgi:homoserine O-acetyltransferase